MPWYAYLFPCLSYLATYAVSLDRMDELMADLSGNAKLRPVIDDGEADVALWNKEIAKYFQGARTPRLEPVLTLNLLCYLQGRTL